MLVVDRHVLLVSLSIGRTWVDERGAAFPLFQYSELIDTVLFEQLPDTILVDSLSVCIQSWSQIIVRFVLKLAFHIANF